MGPCDLLNLVTTGGGGIIGSDERNQIKSPPISTDDLEKLALYPSQHFGDGKLGGSWRGFRQGFNEKFVIGVVVADLAKGYPYQVVSSRTLVEDQLGDFPIMIWVAEEDYRVYLRLVEDRELHFKWLEGRLVDLETRSLWNPQLGVAIEGVYQGQVLQQLPSLSIFRSSWEDFYFQGTIYQP